MLFADPSGFRTVSRTNFSWLEALWEIINYTKWTKLLLRKIIINHYKQSSEIIALKT